MKIVTIIALAACSMAGVCSAQPSPALCPRHIETPEYPMFARSDHLTGTVVLRVTVGADGTVIEAASAPGTKASEILQQNAIENVRHWTFAEPPTVPNVETIVYNFELDYSLPLGAEKVSHDLPDRVNIRANSSTTETVQ
ncbi:MAG: TonB family protein [Candidatus Acidiferrales bacterium]